MSLVEALGALLWGVVVVLWRLLAAVAGAVWAAWSDLSGFAQLRLVAAALVVALLYAGVCKLWPIGNCWCCEGKGTHKSPSGKYRRKCLWCRGAGSKTRRGRRVWRFLVRAKENAK